MAKFPVRSMKPTLPLITTRAKPSVSAPACSNFGSMSQLPSVRASPHSLSLCTQRIDGSSLSNPGDHEGRERPDPLSRDVDDVGCDHGFGSVKIRGTLQ